MKSIWLMFFILFPTDGFSACDCGSTDALVPCTGNTISVTVVAGTPNGGTAANSVYNWAFNSGGGDATCGQFANGDYWIAPAAGQSSVTITGITTTSPGAISADADPVMESMGLLSGTKTYGNYNATENIIPNLPVTYSTVTSLVSAIQRNEVTEGTCGTSAILGNCADSYNVVTVLQSVPVNAGSDMIRPNITGTTKELLRLADFDFTRVPSKSFLTGTNTAGIESIRQRWSHSIEIFGLYSVNNSVYYSEGGRAFRSHVLVDDYGGGTATAWYDDMVVIFSAENTVAEKRPALAAMLTYGLDLYHAMYDAPPGTTRYWGSGATQHPGKFIPAVLLGAFAKSSTYANNLKTAASQVHVSTNSGPHELSQLMRGVNGVVWGDISTFVGSYIEGAYWEDLHTAQCYDGAVGPCSEAVGKKTLQDPYHFIDGPPPRPGSSYMQSSLGVQRSLVAMMFLMPEICEIVNYDDIVEYVGRIESSGVKTANDPCVTPDSRENPTTCDAYRNTGCLYYKVTWGPDPANPGSCIKTPTPPYTKVGRFAAIDGATVGMAYTSFQVENNWETIMALRGTTPPSGGGTAHRTNGLGNLIFGTGTLY